MRSLLLLAFAAAALGATDAPIPKGDDNAANLAKNAAQIDERFLDLERQVLEQNALVLRRTEQVEARLDASQRQIDSILLIYALVLLLGFFFIVNNLRIRQRWSIDRINHATHNAETLMKDIQREINRPELEHLRISQLLRRFMRQLRAPDQANLTSNKHYIDEVRNAANNAYLPVSLHFIARTLTAEHDGNWSTALQMLEQLRDMDPKDPDVLLHLSHVHKNIATNTSDSHIRNRHKRLSYQFYTRFTAAINTQHMQSDTESEEKETFAPSLVEVPTETPPPQQKTAPPPTASHQRKVIIPTVIAKPIAATPVVTNQTTAKIATLSAKDNTKTASQTPTSPARDNNKTISQPSTSPDNDSNKTVTKTAISPANDNAAKKKPQKNILQNIKNNIQETTKNITALSGNGLIKFGNGIRSVTNIIKESNDGPLPPLPAPIISEIPTNISSADALMWKEIRNGDAMMERAANAKNLRQRNRIIDSAMVAYARAQAHRTNKTLYHNWGIALLAKALHVDEKKRAAFYNAAVDKFLAGNVIAPHYFDFHLASLHAIIGNKDECRKWLDKSLQSESLDVESLMQAPDFDSVRNEPWFDKFLES